MGVLIGKALIDSGSEASFVTEALMQLLELPRRHAELSRMGIGVSQAGRTRGVTLLKVKSRYNQKFLSTDAYVLSQFTMELLGIPVTNILWGCIGEEF